MNVNGQNSYEQLLDQNCMRGKYDLKSNLRVFNDENLKIKLLYLNEKSNNFHISLSPDLAKIIKNFYLILSNLNHLSEEKWSLSETGCASFNYIKNILGQAKARGLIKNYSMASTGSKITFNAEQHRGSRLTHISVNICEPVSQILCHVMKNGVISYEKADWERIERQECGKKKPRQHQVRFFNYVLKEYQYVTNERLSKKRLDKMASKFGKNYDPNYNKNNNNNNNNNSNNNMDES